MEWVLLSLVIGINFPIWTMVAIIRLVVERRARRGEPEPSADALRLDEVAMLIPAHDEEPGIATTIRSALRQVSPDNVHVIADGCRDRTAEVAAEFGVRVLELTPGRGKAGALRAAIDHFQITERFDALLIVDADTEIDEGYVRNGLVLLSEPGYAAVAGFVRTRWEPTEHTFIGRVLVSYRTRLWTVMQWMRYGQAWRHINVTPIVPGFASMYRTSVLPEIDLNPPGLVIEDFNMTFELHHKRLGKIAFSPSVSATTDDPGTLRDYYRQILRWALGLWQTLRRHGVWAGRFFFVTAFFMLEVLTASAFVLALVTVLALLALVPLTGGWVLAWPAYRELHDAVAPWASTYSVLVFAFLPDYVLTCIAAVWHRRPSLLIYGFAFLFMRAIDAAASIWTLYRLWRAKSTGRWQSPRPWLVGADSAEEGDDWRPRGSARRVVLLDAALVVPMVTVVILAMTSTISVLIAGPLFLVGWWLAVARYLGWLDPKDTAVSPDPVSSVADWPHGRV